MNQQGPGLPDRIGDPMSNHRSPWRSLVLAVFCLALLPQSLHALAMGPGMLMVQAVPPGQEVDLHKLGGTLFTIYNRSDKDQDYNLTCSSPSKGGVTEWEKGYEEIPDAGWCRVEEAVFTIPAKSEKQVGLIIRIPDAPENYNRKFMLAVVLKSGRNVGTSVGLAVASRVQIETAVKGQLAESGGGAIALAPGTISIAGKPGGAVSGTVQVRNNTGQRLEAQIERLPQVYADPAKHARYGSAGRQLQLAEPWLAPRAPGLAIDPGGVFSLEFSGAIPAAAVPGQRYEELAFINARLADGTPLMTFVRLQVDLAAGDAGKPAAPIPANP
jgi:hypothetical protein